MSVIYIALPIALVVAVIAVVAFVVQVRTGQYDDLDTPPRRMLFDDVETGSKRPRVDLQNQPTQESPRADD